MIHFADRSALAKGRQFQPLGGQSVEARIPPFRMGEAFTIRVKSSMATVVMSAAAGARLRGRGRDRGQPLAS